MNHRIKNNLLMVSSLISLKEHGPEEGKKDLSDLANQVEAIRLVHEKLFESDEAISVPVREYMEEFLYVIFSSNVTYKVEQQIEIEVGYIPTKTLLPLALIVNELATNAVKHGFSVEGRTPDGTRPVFSVSLERKEKTSGYTMEVKNNGAPLPVEGDLSEKRGFGLGLVALLAEQLDGSARIERVPHPKFVFDFPLLEISETES